MSQENVEVVRRSYEHFNRTGDGSRRTFDPHVYGWFRTSDLSGVKVCFEAKA
jgi:hypothetical protein